MLFQFKELYRQNHSSNYPGMAGMAGMAGMVGLSLPCCVKSCSVIDRGPNEWRTERDVRRCPSERLVTRDQSLVGITGQDDIELASRCR
jgi:hypothetical protein